MTSTPRQRAGASGPLRSFLSRLPLRQFARYVAVGGISTLGEWLTFYLFAIRMALHYQLALVLSTVIAIFVHFTLNKFFTFRCDSRRLLRQFALHVSVSMVYLALSMACMYALVDLGGLHKMASKVATTGIMMSVSYTLHKFITFNRRLLR